MVQGDAIAVLAANVLFAVWALTIYNERCHEGPHGLVRGRLTAADQGLEDADLDQLAKAAVDLTTDFSPAWQGRRMQPATSKAAAIDSHG